jgi:benzoyl-CoA reductase/2-hydroxyglutaryl-CoA dehydratase subunit BcrC/BadD/HgdB
LSFGSTLQRKLQDGSAAKFLRSPWPYRFLSPLLLRESLNTRLSFQITRDAYLGRKPVAFTSLFFPAELVYAMGMTPFPLESIAGMTSSLGMSVTFLQKAEEQWYSPDLCSFHRVGLGMAINGLLPKPTAVLSLSALCDGSNRYFANIAQFFKVPHFLIDVPQQRSPESLAYVEDQIRQIRSKLEILLQRRVQTADWQLVFARSKEMTDAWSKIMELQIRTPAAVDGDGVMGNVSTLYSLAGNPWGGRIFRQWRQRLEREVPKAEKYRLFWLHLFPFYRNDLYDFLESKGVSLVGDEMTSNPFPPLDPSQAERSIATKIYANAGIGGLEVRLQHILEKVRERKAQGVIHWSHRGCRQATGGAYLLKEKLRQAGIPTLILDGDCIDPREYTSEQLHTRIEGFLELL